MRDVKRKGKIVHNPLYRKRIQGSTETYFCVIANGKVVEIEITPTCCTVRQYWIPENFHRTVDKAYADEWVLATRRVRNFMVGFQKQIKICKQTTNAIEE